MKTVLVVYLFFSFQAFSIDCKKEEAKVGEASTKFRKTMKRVDLAISKVTKTKFDWAKKNHLAAVIELSVTYNKFISAEQEWLSIAEGLRLAGISNKNDREYNIAFARKEMAYSNYERIKEKFDKTVSGWKQAPEGKKALAEEEKAKTEDRKAKAENYKAREQLRKCKDRIKIKTEKINEAEK